MFSRLETWFEWLQADPVNFLIYAFILTATVLISLTFHEVAHGYVAYRCGDPTAKMLGRLSLNPLKHMDPIGTLCMFLLGFGWAKPVPVNPRNFTNYRRDDFLVSIAGVTVNFSLFILSTAALVAIRSFVWTSEALMYIEFDQLMIVGDMYAQFANPGLSEAVAPLVKTPWLLYVQQFLSMFASINLGLGIFNLLPIPPLDGFHVFNDILLKGRLRLDAKAFRISQAIVLLLCFSGVVGSLMGTVMDAVQSSVLNLFLMMTGGA